MICKHVGAGLACLLAAAQVQAQPRDLLGTWRVTSGVVAPWVLTDSAKVNRTAYLTNMVQLRVAAFRGLGRFACANPRYDPTTMPPEDLFQGGLPAPAAAAARSLGFDKGAARGVSLSCALGIFEFHAPDESHLLVAIDNVIWTLDRSPGALAAAASPEGVVQRLLEAHFAGSMGFDSTAVQRVRPFLTTALAGRIAKYLAAPKPADEVPVIDGDPFTNSQEYPTRFSVQRATVSATRAVVVVRFADGYASRSMRYHLRRGPTGWRVDEITYQDGSTFSDQLRVPASVK